MMSITTRFVISRRKQFVHCMIMMYFSYLRGCTCLYGVCLLKLYGQFSNYDGLNIINRIYGKDNYALYDQHVLWLCTGMYVVLRRFVMIIEYYVCIIVIMQKTVYFS